MTKKLSKNQKPVLENHPVRLSSPVKDLGISLGVCRIRGAVDPTPELEPLSFLEVEPGGCNDLCSGPPCPVVGDRPLVGNALVPIHRFDAAQPLCVSVAVLHVQGQPHPAVGPLVSQVAPLVLLPVRYLVVIM